MEFRERSEEFSASDEEEEEALSFCDLVAERETLDKDGTSVSSWESALWDSNTGSEDFDFEFGRSASAPTYADDLFHQGRLLPLTVQRSRSESDAKIASTKSKENRMILNEKLQAWKIDSLDSQRVDFAERTSQRDNSAAPSGKSKSKSKSKVNRSSSAATSAGKNSLKWQFFTLGIMKTPPMKLEDMRLRQGKTNNNNNGIDSSLKRSVSYNYEEKEAVAVKFQFKSKSVKENMLSEEPQHRSKGWKILAPLTSLNGCKVYSNSVINCSTAKKRVDSRGLAEDRNAPARKPPVYADQNSLNFGSKIAASAKARRGGGGSRDRTINGSRVEFHRLSFHNGSYPTATLQSV